MRQRINIYPLDLQFVNNEFKLYQLKKKIFQQITSNKDDTRDMQTFNTLNQISNKL
jgi:hypothetical protein